MAPQRKTRRKRPGSKAKGVKKVAIPFEERPEDKLAPHSFVITRGIRSRNVVHISRDLRRMLAPYTASNLRERRCNKIRDFVALSGIFHVSYMCVFTQSENALSLKIAKLPKGPTLTFKVHQYTLSKDVISNVKSQLLEESAFQFPPVVILNGFTGEGKHLKLMAATFQNMFPPINLTTVKLHNIRRCLLFSYNPTTKLIDMRHFMIRTQPVGLNKGVKKVVNRHIPDLSKFEDISDFVAKADLLSESEFEDEEKTVVMPQTTTRGNVKENKSAIKLFEIGPRFTIQLIKIEEGLLDGEVFFHEFIKKTDEEVNETRKRREKRKRLKEQRKKKMEEDVARKKKAKEAGKKQPEEDFEEVPMGEDVPESDLEKPEDDSDEPEDSDSE